MNETVFCGVNRRCDVGAHGAAGGTGEKSKEKQRKRRRRRREGCLKWRT